MKKPLVLIAFVLAGSLRAALLPGIFSDGMVLQQQKPVPIWGWAEPGEDVRVRFADQEKSARAGEDGRWAVSLDPMEAAAGSDLEITSGPQARTIKNVAIGEVWFCSGQSNMEFYASGLGEKEMSEANNPDIRFFRTDKEATAEPCRDAKGRWLVCQPGKIGMVSAIGYLFAKDIQKRMGVPVGIIQSGFGNTRIEYWMPLESLRGEPGFASYVKKWEEVKDKLVPLSVMKASAKKNPPTAAAPPDPVKVPASLYNGMVAPLVPYAIRGILWYQGESNAYQALEYRKLFPVMIQSWRKAWHDPKLPFLFVQLPNYKKREAQPPAQSHWALQRESQDLARKAVPNTAMVVTIDVGEEDIHPKNKPEVARRLLLAARANVYGEKIPWTGPRFQEAVFEGAKVRITWECAEGGLKAVDGAPVKGFAVAGEDKVWHWAEAEISGNQVLLHSASVAKPVAVRYAWAENPECNLTDSTGLPATPFRTDAW